MISPDLTLMKVWLEGTVIEVETIPLSVLLFLPKPQTKTCFSGRKICLKLKQNRYLIHTWKSVTLNF